jgi:tRNA dimethylallyltransferase
MFREGLLEEAWNLFSFKNLNSLNTVGYKELFSYFEGKISLEEAKEKIKADSRKYARKQLTWFSADPSINWFSPTMDHDIINFLENQIR